MQMINKTLILRSEEQSIPSIPTSGNTNLTFTFNAPNDPSEGNFTEIISQAYPDYPFTIETCYFQIPQIPGIRLVKTSSSIEKYSVGIGLFDGVGNLVTSRGNFPFYMKNPQWETKVNLGIKKIKQVQPLFTKLYYQDYDNADIILTVDASSIPQSLIGEPMQLELIFVVNTPENLGF